MKEDELGKIAELEFKKRAISRGFIVNSPENDRGGYDFIIDCGDRLTKIQVKSTAHCEIRHGKKSYKVRSMRSGGKKEYDKNDFDFLALYIHGEDLMYIIPIDKVGNAVRVIPNSSSSKYNKFIDAWDLV